MAPGAGESSPMLRELIGNLPAVVLAGRTNVGKSTLFNRLSGHGRAIISAEAGTTRDLNVARLSHEGRDFALVDSAGLDLAAQQTEARLATAQAAGAIANAALVIFVVDGRAGVGGADRELFDLVRAAGRPVIVAVNKIDHPGQDAAVAEAYALGAAEVIAVSAAHGRGLDTLLDTVAALLPSPAGAPTAELPDLRLGLVGRPNVGKSSLLNRLVGYERALVADRPGTTRDPVDVILEHDGKVLRLVDTAGIPRPTRVAGDLEQHSVQRAIETIRRADVLALVIDAVEGITDQDARIARLIDHNDRALMVVCNKWDAARGAGKRVPAFVRHAHQRYPFLEYAPLIFTSALTGDGIRDLLPTALRAGEAWRAHFQTALLNRILAEALAAMDPPLVAGRRLKLMYVTQVATSPPRLVFFSNLERELPAHYVRFLETRFRAALGLAGSGTPLRLEFRRATRSTSQARSGEEEPHT